MTGKLNCLVLFDIDGTLVTGPERGPSAGLLSMNDAARQLTGVDRLGDPREFAGRTDVQIARMLLELAGEDNPHHGRVDALIDIYLRNLAVFTAEYPYSALGNPKEAVQALTGAGAMVALGTGNVLAGAEIKLRSAGLHNSFAPLRGGFGDRGDTRAQVLHFGQMQCDPTGLLPLVIVGDTPRDISAGREINAFSIGIPYRNNTEEVLAGAGADSVVARVDDSLVSEIERIICS